MAYREPTRAEVEAAEREIMQRRGERILAAEAAAKTKAEAEKGRPPPDPNMVLTFEMGPRRLTETQVQEAAAAYLEQRLVAALKADGYSVPAMPAENKLKLLRQRHAAKGN